MKKNIQCIASDALEKSAHAFQAINELSSVEEFDDLFHDGLREYSDKMYEAVQFIGRVVGHIRACDALKDAT